MNKHTRNLTIGAVAVLAVTTLVATPAMADTTSTPTAASTSPSSQVSAEITAGTLNATLSDIDLGSTVLTGAGQILSNKIASGVGAGTANAATGKWTFTDARGDGTAWGVTVSATDFKSAAAVSGTDTIARVISATALTINTGTITAVGTAGLVDGVPTSSGDVTMPAVSSPSSSVPFITSSANHKGTFTCSPTFVLTIPANAYRSNVDSTKGVQPYVSIVTFTLG